MKYIVLLALFARWENQGTEVKLPWVTQLPVGEMEFEPRLADFALPCCWEGVLISTASFCSQMQVWPPATLKANTGERVLV